MLTGFLEILAKKNIRLKITRDFCFCKQRKISERMEGPKMRSLSCLFEELCSGRSNRGEGAMSDLNGSCTNSALKKDDIKEEIIPYDMPSIVSDQKVLCCYFLKNITFSLVKSTFHVCIGGSNCLKFRIYEEH